MDHLRLTRLFDNRGARPAARQRFTPLGAERGQRLDGLGRSLAAAPSRRAALRLFASAAVAALAGRLNVYDAEAGANKALKNALQKCRKIKRTSAKRRCIKRARDRHAKHRKRKPNASCRRTPTGAFAQGGLNRNAQVFTEPNGGKLKSARILFAMRSPDLTGTFRLALHPVNRATGIPLDTALARSKPVPASTVGTTPKMVRFTFPAPPKLAARRKYALVLTWSLDSCCYDIFYQQPGTCAGGGFFSTMGPSAPFANVFDPPADLIFDTQVVP